MSVAHNIRGDENMETADFVKPKCQYYLSQHGHQNVNMQISFKYKNEA